MHRAVIANDEIMLGKKFPTLSAVYHNIMHS